MTKKSLAIVLTFFLVFSPIYSYAVLPALIAAAASAGGRVLVGNAIKRVGQTALSKGGMAAMAAGLGALAATKSAIEQDGWTVGGGGSGGTWGAGSNQYQDADRNINIEIYKLSDNEEECGEVKICTTSTIVSTCRNTAAEHFHANYNVDTLPSLQDTSDLKFTNKSYVSSNPADYFLQAKKAAPFPIQVNHVVKYSYSRNGNTPSSTTMTISARAIYIPKTCPLNNKLYISQSEFNAYLTKNITVNDAGDLIKNIYNYDYSQHPNIKINNNDFGGNSLNNDLSLNVDPNADIRVSPRLRVDIETKKVNLDNVNDTNCTKNDAGEYDKCDGSEEEDEEETDPDNPAPEEPQPIECEANGFYKKVCDWMDWTKEQPSETEEMPVDVKNIEAESSNKIDMAGECPAPYDLNFTILGYTQNNTISYEPLCGALEMLKPIFIGSGALSGMFILMGYSRPSGTGVNDG